MNPPVLKMNPPLNFLVPPLFLTGFIFFPLSEAGWDDEDPYWGGNRIDAWMKDSAIFLNPEFRCPPFAWPHYAKRTPSGDQVITYPADLTNDLLPPLKRIKPKKKRVSKQVTGMKMEKVEMKKEQVEGATSFEEEFQAAKAKFQAAKKRRLGETGY